jgi:hypothetical protein
MKAYKNMIKFLKIKGTWREVANSANTTINKDEGIKEPSLQWKKRILLSEHSPIRQLMISWKWIDLPYWVSVHLTRHKYGIEHWVRTQRTDRTGINRNELKQGNLVEHECLANAQALINISRKRLCNMASPETKQAWKEMLYELSKKEPELSSICVKECIYRNGFCPEFKSCGYNKTKLFKMELNEYQKNDL